MKKLSKEGYLCCGLPEATQGKVWAFVAIVGQPEGGLLGVAMANEPGYWPISSWWAHGSYDEMQAHADELNEAEGLSKDEAMRIICSSMVGKVKPKPEREAALALAAKVYAYCEEHYGDKDARFDVIVECMSKSEIADELKQAGITEEQAAYRWADKRAGLHHEQELNQAWDGPESVKSSSRYDPKHDPAGPADDDFGGAYPGEERF